MPNGLMGQSHGPTAGGCFYSGISDFSRAVARGFECVVSFPHLSTEYQDVDLDSPSWRKITCCLFLSTGRGMWESTERKLLLLINRRGSARGEGFQPEDDTLLFFSAGYQRISKLAAN